MSDLPNGDASVTSILMVRHTEVYNPRDIVYGRLPRFHLSTVGREQAEKTAAFLAGTGVSELYASPRLRARQTAAILNQTLGCPRVRVSALIDETLTGYQGEPTSILGGKFNFYDPLARPDDESIAMIARRMARFLEMARRRHPGQIVVAISHADPIMILRASVLGLPLVIGSIQGKYYPSRGSVMGFSFLGDAERPVITYAAPVVDPEVTGQVPSSRSRATAEREVRSSKCEVPSAKFQVRGSKCEVPNSVGG